MYNIIQHLCTLENDHPKVCLPPIILQLSLFTFSHHPQLIVLCIYEFVLVLFRLLFFLDSTWVKPYICLLPSDLFHLAWYIQCQSMLLQMADFVLFMDE